jgi:hypothetical protein
MARFAGLGVVGGGDPEVAREEVEALLKKHAHPWK